LDLSSGRGNGFCMVNYYGGKVKLAIGSRGRVDGGETSSLKNLGTGGRGEGHGRVQKEVRYLQHVMHLFLANHLIFLGSIM
jgi:hypothetical protein